MTRDPNRQPTRAGDCFSAHPCSCPPNAHTAECPNVPKAPCNCGAANERLHRFDCPQFRSVPNVPVGTCVACGHLVPSGTHPDSPNRAVRRMGGLHHHACAPDVKARSAMGAVPTVGGGGCGHPACTNPSCTSTSVHDAEDFARRTGRPVSVRGVVIDAKGDQVPACGWREAAARNRVDGALEVIAAAMDAAMTVIRNEAEHLPARVAAQVAAAVAQAEGSVCDAADELRKAAS